MGKQTSDYRKPVHYLLEAAERFEVWLVDAHHVNSATVTLEPQPEPKPHNHPGSAGTLPPGHKLSIY